MSFAYPASSRLRHVIEQLLHVSASALVTACQNWYHPTQYVMKTDTLCGSSRAFALFEVQRGDCFLSKGDWRKI